MNWSIKILKIKGININVHLTFVLILGWAAYRWSSSTGAGLQGAVFGVVATLLLFTAVALHELGHSFQALKLGVGVRDITLMPIGGVAQMDRIPENPAHELRIAISGPLVNFALAVLLIGVGVVLQAFSLLTFESLIQSLGQISWTGMLAYLIAANLVLGIFNLIPAFPMDGGRVLRALLAFKMDYNRATSIAVFVGQGLAWALGIGGFMSGNYTLILIAIFIWMAAGQEGRQADLKHNLRGITVRQAMTLKPLVLAPNDSLDRAVEFTLTTSQTDFPVVHGQDSSPAGLLTQADLLKGLREQGGHAPVSQHMHTRFPTAKLDEPLFDAQERMSAHRVQALPVIDSDGLIAGMLTAADANEAYHLLSAGSQISPAVQEAV